MIIDGKNGFFPSLSSCYYYPLILEPAALMAASIFFKVNEDLHYVADFN